jgi:hypothetical protein
LAIADSIKTVQFVTDGAGHRTGVLLDIRTWESLLAWIEDATDVHLAASALRELAAGGGRPGEAGWVSWQDARKEWLEEKEDNA